MVFTGTYPFYLKKIVAASYAGKNPPVVVCVFIIGNVTAN